MASSELASRLLCPRLKPVWNYTLRRARRVKKLKPARPHILCHLLRIGQLRRARVCRGKSGQLTSPFAIIRGMVLSSPTVIILLQEVAFTSQGVFEQGAGGKGRLFWWLTTKAILRKTMSVIFQWVGY